jgi:hypothetical protein
MTTVKYGDYELELGSDELVELRESTSLMGSPTALRDRLAEDGYLFVREFHDPDLVHEARMDVLDHMAQDGLLDPEEPVEDGIVGPDVGSQFQTFDMSGESWTHYPSLEQLAEGDAIMGFFEDLLGEQPTAFDRKLGRAKAPGGFTKFHIDRVFMSIGTANRYTVWRPIGDCPVEMGSLVLCPKSNNHDRLRDTYGQVDAAMDECEAHFSDDPYDVIETIGGPLATADFEAGDALIFDPFMLHGALNNQTERFRISIDTRYQSLYEPIDPRWVGADTTGAFPDGGPEDETPMADLRAEWAL